MQQAVEQLKSENLLLKDQQLQLESYCELREDSLKKLQVNVLLCVSVRTSGVLSSWLRCSVHLLCLAGKFGLGTKAKTFTLVKFYQ